jgi:hypothetical protein
MNHTTIRLAIIVIAATLMVSGTLFYPMARKQQLAYSLTSSAHVKYDDKMYSAFANNQYKKIYDNENNVRDGDQFLKCLVVENGGISDNSCNNHDGVIPTSTPTPTRTPSPTPTTTASTTASTTATTPIPAVCPPGTTFDLSLKADLPGGPGGFVFGQGTILCVSATGTVLVASIPFFGGVVVVPQPGVTLDGEPTPPAPGTCPTGNVVAVVASGTVPTAFPTPASTATPIVIGPLGVCVHF